MRDRDVEAALDRGKTLDEVGGGMLDQKSRARLAAPMRAREAAAEKSLVGDLCDHG